MTDIWIVGLGVQNVTQVTPEVERAVRSSREVLSLDTGVATRTFLESLCPRVTSLYDQSYFSDQPRVAAYEHMAIRVVEAALDHPPVSFAIHGHPLVAVRAPFLILELAKALKLRVLVLPGVSAFDTICADLRIDPIVNGMQMYEATDLLLRRRPLQPDVPAILWQIGPLETCLHSMRVSRPERFEGLVAYLCQFYPPRHQCAAVYSSPHPLIDPDILRFPLDELPGSAERIHGGFTMYIPPVGSRPIQDFNLLEKVYSAEHLQNITR